MDRPTPTGPAAPDLRIVESRVYRGGNIWSYDPSIHLVVDLGVLEEWPSVRLGEAFQRALLDALPGLEEHGCSYGAPGGFLRRLNENEGTWLGHVLEHCAIELQSMAGVGVNGLPRWAALIKVAYCCMSTTGVGPVGGASPERRKMKG